MEKTRTRRCARIFVKSRCGLNYRDVKNRPVMPTQTANKMAAVKTFATGSSPLRARAVRCIALRSHPTPLIVFRVNIRSFFLCAAVVVVIVVVGRVSRRAGGVEFSSKYVSTLSNLKCRPSDLAGSRNEIALLRTLACSAMERTCSPRVRRGFGFIIRVRA